MRKRLGLLGLAAGVILSFLGASRPLNPLVIRLAHPDGPVPGECEESLAPPTTPRVNVAEIPDREIELVALPAPPSRSLKEELEAAHRALAENDRPAFDEHLSAARALVSIHPAGGERSRAEEVLWALNDAAVLWDAQFQSPFFDESSEAFTRANRYAGYAEAVRRGVLTDARSQKFYPAAESRDFVTRVAGERLQRLGVRTTAAPPARVARVIPSVEKPRVVATKPAPAPVSRPRSRKTTPRKTPPAVAKASKPEPPKTAAAPRPSEPAPTTAPPAVPPVVTETVAPVAPDTATTSAAPETSPAPVPAPAPAQPQAEQRSVVVPALMILIGLGVLVVLFRASK